MEHIDVRILDREYRLAVPSEEKPRLLDAVRLVDDKMQALRAGGRIGSFDRIAVMAALQLAHELAGNDHVGPRAEQARQQVQRLTAQLDSALDRIQATDGQDKSVQPG